MCQKASGNYFQAFTGVPRADFVWTRGQPGTFLSSAAVARDFCRECGSPLTYRRVAGDRVSVTVGSLDQPYDFQSELQYGLENRPDFADRLPQGDGITSAQSTARVPGDYASRQHPDHDTTEWPPGGSVSNVRVPTRRAKLLEAKLGVRVQVLSPGGHLMVKCLDAIRNLHGEPLHDKRTNSTPRL